ncbi:MAG TPA: YggS family pyridoxal phosphate-dependent enzyme [Candidatus Binataceae bacterium]|nr:YggS family pyridoxal phosphate-dependent enzyme [Candidatus Binataceae bacterium]
MLAGDEILARLESARTKAASAARRAGRDPSAIRIVLASKTQPPEAIRAAYIAGARDFGENYVQEALTKRSALADLPGIRWHLIGHLQANKAKLAAGAFELIHSLDSARLAIALNRAQSKPPVRVLVEVNLGGETSKTGISPADVAELIDASRGKVEVAGLMTIPPPSDDAVRTRAYFTQLRVLRDRLAVDSGLALSELSMGMSDDYELAIEEGATIVRVGRAIFGERIR